MAYEHKNKRGQTYFLHAKEVKLRSGLTQRIYFFKKSVDEGAQDQLPEGFMVVENERTGLPILKRKK